MTENSAARVRAALLDPTAVFAAPAEVERDAALSRDEKLAILAHWEEDALEAADVEAGDTGQAARRVEEVRAARARLGEPGAAAQRESGGAAGRQRVRRFARPVNDIIHADHEMDEAALQLSLQEHPVLPVADGDQVVGVLARSELARAAEQQTRDALLTARVMMTTELAFCYLDDDVATAHALMEKHDCDHLMVIDREGVLVGTLQRGDLPAASPGATQAQQERPEIEAHENRAQGVASTIQPGGLDVYDERPTIRAARR